MISATGRAMGGTADSVSPADVTLPGSPQHRQIPPTGRSRAAYRRRAEWAAGLAAASALLFLAYLRLSQTGPVNSDGAANALQAWDMLHGNLILHGWWLSDVSFYTTELPEYMLIELARGLGPDVVHVAAAVTYTLLVLLAGLLAKGGATGREALARVLIAAGIMLAPQLGSATDTLLLSPDHVGTGVPLLLLWLIIDRAPPRWYVPAAAGVLLALTQVADSVALISGVVPLVVGCAACASQEIFRGKAAATRAGAAPRWYYLSLAGAALASVAAAKLALWLIRLNHGFLAYMPKARLAAAGSLPAHAGLAYQGLLELFGASFAGPRPGLEVIFAVAHLAGLALAGWALVIAVSRFFRSRDLVVPAFAAAIVVNLAAYVFSMTAVDIRSTREIACVLPFGAVLAGRLLAGRMIRAAGRITGLGRLARVSLVSAAAAVVLCYAAGLGYDAAQPPLRSDSQPLAAWLLRHDLKEGLSSYWQADSTMLASGGRLLMSAVTLRGGVLEAGRVWETKIVWRDARWHHANFLVTVRQPGYRAMQQAVLRAFGRPAQVYRFGRYVVMVWHGNLLSAHSLLHRGICGHCTFSVLHPERP